MITFKQFLLEGGNVRIDDHEAERIDLTKHDRTELVSKIDEALRAISAAFESEHGEPIWSEALLKSRKFLSGSAFHFFDEKISNDVFKRYKSSVGDIDTQVSTKLEAPLEEFLTKNKGRKFGPVTLLGYKKSAGQLITLWRLTSPRINIQIDLELVEYRGDTPTEWSNFSHSSSWEDLTAGVKGVAHKMLLRALNAPKLEKVLVKAKTARGKDREVLSASHAFSVTNGIRQKFKPALNDRGEHITVNGRKAYHELSTAESKGETSVSKIFEYFFGAAPSAAEKRKFGSFVGLIDLIKEKLPKDSWIRICDGFVNTLWGEGAQGLYRDDSAKDRDEKTQMVSHLCKELGVSSSRYETMKTDFYRKYK